MGVGGLQMMQAVGPYDDVVRRGCHGRQAADPVGVVAKASERDELEAPARCCRWVTCSVHPGIVRVSAAWEMIGGEPVSKERMRNEPGRQDEAREQCTGPEQGI
ncbi:hypothetical protein GCM10009564_24920 [Streptomyces thermogriseus]|uniref:Uncharacterized protein n=1 Tax=Streptomyces thermogriseus TaxID=75292 RepID=A0ABN1SZ72_9ACTN